jgi:outer membrane protein TolC
MQKKLLVLGLCGMSLMAFSQQKISLEDCIDQAQKHSPQAAQIPLINQATELQIKALNGSYLPQSSIGGQATWQSEVTSLAIKLPNVTITPPSKDQYKATLDITQNIWDGGMTAKQKSLTLSNAKVEEQKIYLDLYQIKEQASNLFFGIAFARRQIVNSEILKLYLVEKLNKIKASVANGVSIGSNILSIEARIIEVEQQISDAKSREKSAIEGLALLIGKPLSDNTELSINKSVIFDNQDINRPELLLFDSQKQALLASEGIAKAKNSPKITAFATGGYGRPALNFLSNDFKTYFIGGIQLKIPLSYLYTKSQSVEVQQLRINQQKIEKQKENFILATQIRLQNQINEITRLEEALESDNKLIIIREKIRKTADAQLDNGIISVTDYLMEVNNVDFAKQSLLLHEIQLLQARKNSQFITGN